MFIISVTSVFPFTFEGSKIKLQLRCIFPSYTGYSINFQWEIQRTSKKKRDRFTST